MKNIGDATKRMFERNKQQLRREEIASARNKIKIENKVEEAPLPFDCSEKSIRHPKFVEIKKMYSDGVTIRSIARIVGMSRNTVRNYIRLDEPPTKSRSGSEILKFSNYFKSRIAEKPNIEVMQLWREIRGRGYKGSRSVVYEFLKSHTHNKSRSSPTIAHYIPRQSWTPAQVSLLMYKDKTTLSRSDQALLSRLLAKSNDIKNHL